MTEVTAIPYLLALRRPIAIFGAIGTVIVAALYRETGCWLPSHISKEILKRSKPAFTDRDSAASVISKVLTRWRSAAIQHGLPSPVFTGFAAGRTLPVSKPTDSVVSVTPTATTNYLASSQVGATNCAFVATVAGALPSDDTVRSSGFIIDKQPAKTLTEKVNLRGHLEASLSGVVPRGVSSTAEASSCLHFIRSFAA